jgi:hypothetical protein
MVIYAFAGRHSRSTLPNALKRMNQYSVSPAVIAKAWITGCPAGACHRPALGPGAGHDSIIYFATNSAWVISDLLSASSSSRNLSMSLPVRKTGFSACFSM